MKGICFNLIEAVQTTLHNWASKIWKPKILFYVYNASLK